MKLTSYTKTFACRNLISIHLPSIYFLNPVFCSNSTMTYVLEDCIIFHVG